MTQNSTLFPYNLRKEDEPKTTFPYLAKTQPSTEADEFPYQTTIESNDDPTKFPYFRNRDEIFNAPTVDLGTLEIPFDFETHNDFFGINMDKVTFDGDKYIVDLNGFQQDWFGVDVNETNTWYVYVGIEPGGSAPGYFFAYFPMIIVEGNIADLTLGETDGRAFSQVPGMISIVAFESTFTFELGETEYEAVLFDGVWTVEEITEGES